jgi:hypothetical protein
MPLLTELENNFVFFYKDFALTALPAASSAPQIVG